ncbi:MAG: sulfatase [Phycisphaerae bacterium]|nr:sulfatase [Phycisphaerae bacterium]
MNKLRLRRKSRHLRQYLLCLVLLWSLTGCDGKPAAKSDGDAAARRAPGDRPNVILYMVDTLRADCLGCYGHRTVKTPAFDRLASEGTLFESAIAPSSWTRPSIASILTGLHPQVHGAEQNPDVIPDAIITLAEALKADGYATCCITTNPNMGSFFGFSQGFDEFQELYERRVAGYVDGGRELVTPSDEVTRRAIKWLEQAPEPFLLVTLTVDPHTPYAPPARFDTYGGDYAGNVQGHGAWLKRKDLSEADKQRIRSLYWGEVSFNDHSFGKLDDFLHRQRWYDRTVLLFTSDHGEEFWDHGLRGHGQSLYEEVLHVPLIVRRPGVIAAGGRITDPVRLVDIVPTLLAEAGLPAIPDVDGGLLFGPDNARGTPSFSALEHAGRSLYAMRDYPWKMISNLKSGRKQFFNLAEAPNELHMAAAASAAEASRLDDMIKARLEANAAKRARVHAGVALQQRSTDQLPDDARRTLESLGYVGDDPNDK